MCWDRCGLDTQRPTFLSTEREFRSWRGTKLQSLTLGEIVSAMNNHTKTTVVLRRLKIFITIPIKFTVLLKAEE